MARQRQRCWVAYCKSTYENHAFFRFPSNPEIYAAWVDSLPDKGIDPTIYSKVCCAHFDNSCFIEYKLRKELKSDAIPTIFQTSLRPISKPSVPTSSLCFQSILQEVDDTGLPEDVVDKIFKDKALYYQLKIIDQKPILTFSLLVCDDLSFLVQYMNNDFDLSCLCHICPSKKIESGSQINQILDFLSSQASDDPFSLKLKSAHCNLTSSNPPGSKVKHINFLKEQLALNLTEKDNRKYSAETLATSILWKKMNPVHYSFVQSTNLLILPPINLLDSLKTGNLNFNQDKFKDKFVSLVIEEIDSGKKIIFNEGKIDDKSDVCISFSIKSISRIASDTIAIIPVETATPTFLKINFLKILKFLTSKGLEVVSVICQPNLIMKKLFIDELGDGKVESFIKNPFSKRKSKVFLIYDCISVFTNFYIDILFRKNINFVSFDQNESTSFLFQFDHLKEIYDNELHLDKKMAYTLRRETIYPECIDVPSLESARRFIHPSTISSLNHYGKSYPQFGDFLQSSKLLNILDSYWDCVRDTSPENAELKSEFLMNFKNWLRATEKQFPDSSFTEDTVYFAKSSAVAAFKLYRYLVTDLETEDITFGHFNAFSNMSTKETNYFQTMKESYYLKYKRLLDLEQISKLPSLKGANVNLFEDLRKSCITPQITKYHEKEARKLLHAISPINNVAINYTEEQGVVLYSLSVYISNSLSATKIKNCCVPLFRSKQKYLISYENSLSSDFEKLQKHLKIPELFKPSDLLYLTNIHFFELINLFKWDEKCSDVLTKESCSREIFISSCIQFIDKPCFSQIKNAVCSKGHEYDNYIPQILSMLYKFYFSTTKAARKSK